MEKIFISYRRTDSSHATDRIYTELSKSLGKGNVFKDIDSIGVGVDFRERLHEAIDSSTVMLVIIGNDWLSIKDDNGLTRLYNECDFVRIEVERAIQKKILVIPVLIEESDLPSPEDLPESIQELSYRNAIRVRSAPDYHNDMVSLIKEIKKHISLKNRIDKKFWCLSVVFLAFIFGFVFFIISINHQIDLEDLHDDFSKIRSDYEINENIIITRYRYENIKNNLPQIIQKINHISDDWLSGDYKLEKYDVLMFSYFIMSAIYAREYIDTTNNSFKHDALKNIRLAIKAKENLFKYLIINNKNSRYMNEVYHVISNIHAVSEFLGTNGAFEDTESYLMKIDSIYKQQMNIYNDYFLRKHEDVKYARSKKS